MGGARAGRLCSRLAALALLAGTACGESKDSGHPAESGGAGARVAQGGTSSTAGGRASSGTGDQGGSTAQGANASGGFDAPQGGGALTEGGATTSMNRGGNSPVAGGGGNAGQSLGGTNGASGSAGFGGRSAAGGSRGGSAGSAGSGGTNGVGGASGAAGMGGAAGMTVQQFCELLQPRARSWLRMCRFNFGDSADWWGTKNIDSFCTSGRAAIEAGRLAYDPIRAEACAAKSVGDCNTISAFAFPDGTSWTSTAAACQGVVTPQVPLGGACHANSTRYSSECKGGFCGGSTCPGTCVAYAKLHESCDQTTLCDPSVHVCSLGKCEVYPKLGEACTADSLCDLGLLCALDAKPTPVCAERRGLGQACQWPSQCADEWTTCSQNKCVEVSVPDASCANSGSCPSDSYCDGATCKPRRPVNSDCSDDSAACVQGSYCNSASKCTLYGRDGEACPCADGYWCDEANKCRPKGKLNADCSQSSTSTLSARCEEGLVCRPTMLAQGAASKFVCSAAGAGQGEPCSATFNCKAPFVCEPTSSRCQPPAGKGQACNPGFPLDSCEAGLFCECTGTGCIAAATVPGTCQPRADNGANCANNVGCKSGTCTNQKCAASTDCP